MTTADHRHRQFVPAGELNAVDHIGQLIRFRTWDADREVATVNTAELRQISHNQAETTLTFGLMAEREVTLPGDQLVTIKPPANYSDVPVLAQSADRMTDSRGD